MLGRATRDLQVLDVKILCWFVGFSVLGLGFFLWIFGFTFPWFSVGIKNFEIEAKILKECCDSDNETFSDYEQFAKKHPVFVVHSIAKISPRNQYN